MCPFWVSVKAQHVKEIFKPVQQSFYLLKFQGQGILVGIKWYYKW